MNFENALKIVLNWEGGYVNDPHDPGGETKFGISKKSYPSVDIKSLTLESASEIYKKDYWLKCRCDDLPIPVAVLVFDTAVNMGVNTAIILLQTAAEVVSDGVLGKQTISAVNGLDPAKIARNFMSLRTQRYTKLTGWDRYGLGWTRRCFDVFHRAFAL